MKRTLKSVSYRCFYMRRVEISCVGCNACYVGETTRHFSTRVHEHLTTDTNSHLGKHLYYRSSEHCFHVIDQASTTYQLKIKEALHMLWENPSLNLQLNFNTLIKVYFVIRMLFLSIICIRVHKNLLVVYIQICIFSNICPEEGVSELKIVPLYLTRFYPCIKRTESNIFSNPWKI